MSCSAFDFLEFVGELLLQDLIVVGFDVFKVLILLKNMNIIPEFIDKCSGSMFDQEVCGDEYIMSFVCFINVVLKCLDCFEDIFECLLKFLNFISRCREFVEFGSGDDLLFRTSDFVQKFLDFTPIVDHHSLRYLPEGFGCLF